MGTATNLFGQTVFNVPPDDAPSNIRANQIVNIFDGANLNEFVRVQNRGILNVNGGSINNSIGILNGGIANVLGGNVEEGPCVESGGELHIHGGMIGDRLMAYEGHVHLSQRRTIESYHQAPAGVRRRQSAQVDWETHFRLQSTY